MSASRVAPSEDVQAIELGEAVVVDHAEREVQPPIDLLRREIGPGGDQGVGEAAQVRDVGAQGFAHLRGPLAAGANDELHRYAASVFWGRPAQGGREEGGEDGAHRRLAAVTVGRLVQHPRPLAVELGGAPAEDLEEQGVLGAEMIVDAGQIHPGRRGDVPHRDVLEPVEREQAFGGAEHGSLGGGVALGVLRLGRGEGQGRGHWGRREGHGSAVLGVEGPRARERASYARGPRPWNRVGRIGWAMVASRPRKPLV